MPEEDMSGRVCVLGVGNTLLGDEGFGVRAMEYLRDNYVWPGNVDFVDGGTQGMGLMVCSSACFAEAIRAGLLSQIVSRETVSVIF